MDYEKKYKEALERASHIKDHNTIGTPQEIAELIFPELKESDDERIRKFLIGLLSNGTWRKEYPFSPVECVAWLEKQKEQKPTDVIDPFSNDNFMRGYRSGYADAKREQKPSINIDQLKSLMLQYLREAANEKDDSDIEADTDKWARKILGYNFEQKPVEWSEEDERMIGTIRLALTDVPEERFTTEGTSLSKVYDWIEEKQKEQPHWKPSKEQKDALARVIGNGIIKDGDATPLLSLFADLSIL